ncbi:Hypothetical protein, putative [Bodo saltans]|uniref:Uncharacterized protein n=1 Tax=Bodo saltans TaxID=75058 RepID=A0A0S4JVX2_BODSA|nr:Hypothetical protein, putative [Bodo saltans]|eukprot:CUG93561.1 Hypothetical protein, putative [Bodo saltans]
MASSGHRSSSSASTRSSDGGSPSHFDMTPVSPPKTKGNGSGGHATTKSTKQRQGSTRGSNAPPPRLEDVVLFPATTIGVAGTNLLTMSSSTVTAPPVAAAAGGGSRRKTSAAQQQPFDDLLPTSHNNSSGNPPGSHHPSKVDDDFGSDPFPMQKQKKKKIPIIIDEEWDDVWAFPNEHLQQQQQQQRVVMEQHADEHVQMSNSGVRAGQHEAHQQHGSDLSGLPKPKPRSAWSSSLLSPQNVVPPQGGNSPHAVSPSHKDEQTKSSTSTAQHATTTTTTTIGQRKPSGMSLTRLGSTHGKPTSLSPMNPNSGHAVVDDGMKDGVSSPMLPHGPHPPPTPTNIRSASEGTRAPRPPSTELVANSSSTRRSKEGSFRRSFPGTGFGGLGPVGSDALAPNSRSSFASPTEVDDVDRVLSSALSPTSVTSGGGGDQGMTDGSMSTCPPLHSAGAPPPPPSAVPGSRQQAFARKQHAM